MQASFWAPAKINLCLHVLGKRPDGYHDLVMLMQRLSLCDRVDIALSDVPGVRVVCEGVALPLGGENIAAIAARRMLELSGCSCGVDIFIDKQIPVAAGLGGGSSDAASVLMGLNGMLGLGLPQEQLRAEGLKLGADVPFFIFKGPAWAGGVGDRLEMVAGLPFVWYVLVNPGVAVSTAGVFKSLGLTSVNAEAKMREFPRKLNTIQDLLHNELEKVTASMCPQISEIKAKMLEYGASGALMSGSGPTVFGVFDSEKLARSAARCMEQPGWKVFVCRPLSSDEGFFSAGRDGLPEEGWGGGC